MGKIPEVVAVPGDQLESISIEERLAEERRKGRVEGINMVFGAAYQWGREKGERRGALKALTSFLEEHNTRATPLLGHTQFALKLLKRPMRSQTHLLLESVADRMAIALFNAQMSFKRHIEAIEGGTIYFDPQNPDILNTHRQAQNGEINNNGNGHKKVITPGALL